MISQDMPIDQICNLLHEQMKSHPEILGTTSPKLEIVKYLRHKDNRFLLHESYGIAERTFEQYSDSLEELKKSVEPVRSLRDTVWSIYSE